MHYFFGRNLTDIEFKYFSFAHFAPLILMGLAIYLLYRFRDKIRNSKHEETIRIVIGFTMMICEMSYFWRLLNSDMEPNAWEYLPITICGWACIFGCVMMFTKRKGFFDVCYFWTLSFSFNALITPVPLAEAGPTRFRYYQYWIEHASIYIAVFYMIFVHKYRPNLKSFIPAGATLGAIFILAIIVNSTLGISPEGYEANYLFIASVEGSFSIANLLPSNLFLRYSIIIFLGSSLMFLAYLPWLIMDLKKRKREQQALQNSPV